MAPAKPRLDPGQILRFPFEDPDWFKKLLIASGLILASFVPVIPAVLLLGSMAEIIRRIVVEGEEPSLPAWDDLSGFFNTGLKLFGASLVYTLPAFLLMGLGYAGMFIPVFTMSASPGGSPDGLGLWFVGYLAGFGLMGIGAFLAMLTSLFFPLVMAHVTVKGEFKAAFEFGTMWRIFKANWSGFVVAFLILAGAAMFAYYGSSVLVATLVLCCFYPFLLCILGAYLMVIAGGLFGEAYRVGLADLPPAE